MHSFQQQKDNSNNKENKDNGNLDKQDNENKLIDTDLYGDVDIDAGADEMPK